MELNCTTTNKSFDPYDQNPLVECYKLNYLGAFGVFLFISSIFCNSLYMYVFLKTKQLRTPINTLIFSLSVLSLSGTILQLPIVIYSAFTCKFIFGKVGCYLSGFVMFFVSCMNNHLLVALTIQRYYANLNLSNIRTISYKKTSITIVICALLSLFWSLAPVFGWSYYSLEGAMISCSIEWYSKEFRVISYNIGVFVFVYLIPILIIAILNIKLVFIIHDRHNSIVRTSSLHNRQRTNEIQRDVSIMVFLMIICFFLSWTPYACISIYRQLYGPGSLSPMMATLPAYFGKTSLLWPSLISILTNKTIRNHLPFKKSRHPPPTPVLFLNRTIY